MKPLQSRVFSFAVIRGLMPLGVAQKQVAAELPGMYSVIRGLMPLGVAQ